MQGPTRKIRGRVQFVRPRCGVTAVPRLEHGGRISFALRLISRAHLMVQLHRNRALPPRDSRRLRSQKLGGRLSKGALTSVGSRG